MSIDVDAIRRRHAEMQRHYDAQDEGEFSLAATEALDDVPALLGEIEHLTKAHAECRLAIQRLAKVRVWTNEDGHDFLFAHDVRQALAGTS